MFILMSSGQARLESAQWGGGADVGEGVAEPDWLGEGGGAIAMLPEPRWAGKKRG